MASCPTEPQPKNTGDKIAGATKENVGSKADAAGCAGHVQQLGSESLLLNLMEVKG